MPEQIIQNQAESRRTYSCRSEKQREEEEQEEEGSTGTASQGIKSSSICAHHAFSSFIRTLATTKPSLDSDPLATREMNQAKRSKEESGSISPGTRKKNRERTIDEQTRQVTFFGS